MGAAQASSSGERTPPAPDPQRMPASLSRQAGSAHLHTAGRGDRRARLQPSPGSTHAHRARYSNAEPHTPLLPLPSWLTSRTQLEASSGHLTPLTPRRTLLWTAQKKHTSTSPQGWLTSRIHSNRLGSLDCLQFLGHLLPCGQVKRQRDNSKRPAPIETTADLGCRAVSSRPRAPTAEARR